MMRIHRKSILTGKETYMDLPITVEQVNNYHAGALVQDAFPHLTDSEREFFMSGITDEEWHKYMNGEE